MFLKPFSHFSMIPLLQDFLKQVEEAEKDTPGSLVCRRFIALLVCIMILGAGILVRLFVHVPYDQKPLCIPYPSQGNTTGLLPILPENTTLPWCNATQPAPPAGVQLTQLQYYLNYMLSLTKLQYYSHSVFVLLYPGVILLNQWRHQGYCLHHLHSHNTTHRHR